MKFKILRVITSSNVIPWHMDNTLSRISNDFDVYIVGDNVSEYKLKYPNIKFIDLKIERKINFYADIKALYKLFKIIKYIKPDIVHSIMPKSGLLSSIASFLNKVPVRIHTFTGQMWVGQKSIMTKLYYLIDKLINKLNTVCLTDSPSQSQFLSENGISNKGKPLLSLGKGSLSGVNIDKYNAFNLDKKKIKKKLNIQDNDFVFSFIARKTVEKGSIDLLNTFSIITQKFPNTKLLFIGPYEDKRVDNFINENPKVLTNVISIEAVPNAEKYLSITDVLCLPSYREGFGSIIIDSAIMGVPSVGSNIVGLLDSIEDKKSGLLFNVGDLDALEKAMESFLNNRFDSKIMGEYAKERAFTYFTADYMYNELKNFYIQQIKIKGKQ